MISLDIVTQFVLENFQKVTVSKNGSHFHARCPLCGDSKKSLSKKRFHMDNNNGQPFWHCFNCHRSGSFLEIYSELKGITINEAKKELFKFDAAHLTQILSPKKKEKIIKEIQYETHNYILDDCISSVDIVDGFMLPKYQQILKDFMVKRKIPETFKIFIAYKGDYKDRIIIPIYDNGDIVYFQARAIGDVGYGDKYKNPSIQKGTVILNKDYFEKDKFIIVTEGILDALPLGTQGTSCLGSSVTDDFINLLKPYTDTGIIIALDNDDSGLQGIKKILSENKSSHLVKYFIMPYKYNKVKDLNELSISYDIDDMYQFVINHTYDKFSTQIMLNMEECVNEINNTRKGLSNRK